MTATANESRKAEIGAARRRKEDQRLITGRTRWTDNLTPPGTLHLAMVRSPFAHATITSIDTNEAKDAPNVVTVITGAEVAEEQGVLITAWPLNDEQKSPTHTPIAVDRVAFAGLTAALSVQEFGGSLSAPGWAEIAAGYGVPVETAATRDELDQALATAFAEPGPHLVLVDV